MSQLQPVLTVKDVAAYLQVHQSSIYRLIKRGMIPTFKVGADWRFRADEIDKWRNGLENGGAK